MQSDGRLSIHCVNSWQGLSSVVHSFTWCIKGRMDPKKMWVVRTISWWVNNDPVISLEVCLFPCLDQLEITHMNMCIQQTCTCKAMLSEMCKLVWSNDNMTLLIFFSVYWSEVSPQDGMHINFRTLSNPSAAISERVRLLSLSWLSPCIQPDSLLGKYI
jgi:hypothetical protein